LTRHLDFFGLSAEAVDRLLPVVERAPAADGFSVDRVQVGSGFARLIVLSGDDRTELDLASDARLFPVEVREPAPLLSREELAIDKLPAVFGRAEARDFIDLMQLERAFGLEHLGGSQPPRTGVKCIAHCREVIGSRREVASAHRVAAEPRPPEGGADPHDPDIRAPESRAPGTRAAAGAGLVRPPRPAGR
jgi:hypothetical protein